MPGFFEARDNFKTKNKKHFVTIDGKTVEVSLEQKIEILQSGESAWKWENNEIVKKPQKKLGRYYTELTKTDKGYHFIDSDPYWPSEFKEGGYTWQQPSE